jgi:hypothetical protein
MITGTYYIEDDEDVFPVTKAIFNFDLIFKENNISWEISFNADNIAAEDWKRFIQSLKCNSDDKLTFNEDVYIETSNSKVKFSMIINDNETAFNFDNSFCLPAFESIVYQINKLF